MEDSAAMCVIDDWEYQTNLIRSNYEKQLIEAVLGTNETHQVEWSMLVSLDPFENVRWLGSTIKKHV